MSGSTADSAGGDSRAGTVLVVDDEPSVVQLYAGMLSSEHTVHVATGGEEALKKMDASVDVVLLDRRMPDLTGDEVLDRLRSAGYDSMVAIVTAMNPEQRVISMDFDAYRVKPIGKEEINDLVDELLLRSEYSDELRELIATSEKLAALRSRYDRDELEGLDEYTALTEQYAAAVAESDDRFKEITGRVNPALVYRDVLED